jgi:aminopeptidase
MEIEWVHVVGEDVDLKVKIGEKRKWLGGSGRNIPSFEVFTSPDWRGTNGWIRYNMPLSYQSNIIKWIRLEFKDGLVVNATATENEKLLKEMIAQKDADKAGEFSLTDRRLSRITKFMGETLYDENVGGPFGNTHIALGMAYKDAYTLVMSQIQRLCRRMSTTNRTRLGYNDLNMYEVFICLVPRITSYMIWWARYEILQKNNNKKKWHLHIN